MSMSNTKAKRLRRLAGPGGVTRDGKIAPVPKAGSGHWSQSGAGTHADKRRKNERKLREQSVREW